MKNYSIDAVLSDFIAYDNKVAFIRWIAYKAQSVGGFVVFQSLMLSEIVDRISKAGAFKCATALLQGKTGLKLDFDGVYTLAVVVLQEDIRFAGPGQLPLNVAIQNISELPQFIGWFTRQSLYMMIVFCQCETEILDSIGFLFRVTHQDDKEMEISCYVQDAKLVVIAALLTVAREEVTSPSLFKVLCPFANWSYPRLYY
ncbi:hypothetical protein V6N13_068948 [Hibiscus sabdariffa]